MNHCAFPSDACNGGLEFGALAEPDLVGQCVDGPTLGTSSGATGSSDSSMDEGTLTGAADGGSTVGSDTLGVGDSSGTTTTGGTTTGTSEGTSSGGELPSEFVATYATCAFADRTGGDPNPAACLMINPGDGFTVDASAINGMTTYGYVLFELGDDFVPDGITEVALHLRVAQGDNAASTQSGAVYQVAAFSEPSLQAALPAVISDLAPDQGPVAPDDEVVWILPPDLLSSGATSLYLSLQTRANDGVVYWTEAGSNPPRLVITRE